MFVSLLLFSHFWKTDYSVSLYKKYLLLNIYVDLEDIYMIDLNYYIHCHVKSRVTTETKQRFNTPLEQKRAMLQDKTLVL